MKKTIKTIGKHTALAIAISSALANVNVLAAEVDNNEDIEVIQVTGMLSSLKRAMSDKKENAGVSDGIAAEDLGKFPDLNVAESLQRITGVSIDRSGGEGQSVTVRGFGPQFNTVLVNGRQIATDSAGREFNFDIIAADQITGANIYKTGAANLQEGGIGGTINVTTAKPFDYEGFNLIGSLKGTYETLAEKTSPAASVLISNTFNDDRLGVLLAVSHSEREVLVNRIETQGWRPGQTISNDVDGVLFTNAYIPRNWDQISETQDRTRTNASLVLQYAPTDEVTITVDGFLSKFEVDAQANDLASWFEPDRVGSATIDEATGTLTSFTQEVGIGSSNPASDFVSHTRNGRDTTTDGFGIKVEWDIAENLQSTFDFSSSSAENDQAGQNRFNVAGIVNNYTFDGTGGLPTVVHDGFENGNLPDAGLTSYHYNEINGFTDEDEVVELKADFVYLADGDVFEKVQFGIYRQEREKSRFQVFGNSCNGIYCSYKTPIPGEDINLREFTAPNYFPGLIDTYYTFDGNAYLDLLETVGQGITPTLQNNRYTVKEDISSIYADFTFAYELGDMPVTVNFGARYSTTSVEAEAIQSDIADVIATSDLTLFGNEFGPVKTITEGSSYSNLLPSLNVKLELQEDMIVRFSVYDSLTRPTMGQLSPATVFGEPRRQNLTASGGNEELKPFTSENWDISFEWYYDDASLFSFAFFNKEVDDFIITLTGDENYSLANRTGQPNFDCDDDLCRVLVEDPNDNTQMITRAQAEGELNGQSEIYTVTRPQNGEAARVTGYEVALTHIFENGFGFTANATVVDSNVSLGDDQSTSFALEGLGDSQNLILFYEADDWQARIAYNNREGFLRFVDNGNTGEPVNTETFGQWDASASWDITEQVSVFIEGINITKEELVQTGRFANQIYNIEDNGSRYAVGIRGKF